MGPLERPTDPERPAAGDPTVPERPAAGERTVPLFELDGVSLVLNGHTLLDNVSVAVPDRGVTALLGPSGAGKSTILRLLNRLEVPSSGRVCFRGRALDDIDPLTLRRTVGMVFQRPTPFPGTVRDNLLVADPAAEAGAMLDALVAAGLGGALLDRLADDLSVGEAQRMCLARTLLTRPDVLLMDEPTSALDPDARRRLEAAGLDLAAAGRRIVWVTHDLAQAARMGDHTIVIVGGRLATTNEMSHYLATGSTSTSTAGQEGHREASRPSEPLDEDLLREEGEHG